MNKGIWALVLLAGSACSTASWSRAECEAAAKRPQELTGKADFDLYQNTCCAGYDCRMLTDSSR